MNASHRLGMVAGAGLGIAALVLGGCAGMSSHGMSSMHTVSVSLSGSEEVPPVSTSASGSGTIRIAPDRSVSGSVTTASLSGTAAHIHQGARGQNGPVAVPLVNSGDSWSVPAGTKLTDAQYDAFKAGNLYVNVHSAANKGGEIRGQLNP